MKIKKKITIEELKKCKGFENYSEQEAEETINNLETISILFYELYMKRKQMEQNLTLIKGGKYDEEEQRNVA
jgi:hypothetical protein